MVAPSIVAFEPLIPSGAGDAPPCRASVVTIAERNGVAIPITVVDRGIAEQALRSGGWAREMVELAMEGVTVAHVRGSASIAAWLAERGIAVHDETLRVRSFGELDAALALNGIALVDTLPGVLDHPGVVSWRTLDARGIERALEAWRAAIGSTPPERALAIDVRGGASFFGDARAAPFFAAIAGPWRLRSVVWDGDGDRLALALAIRRIVESVLRAPSKTAPSFALGDGVSADVRAFAEGITRLDPDTFAILRERAGDDERVRRRLDDAERTLLFRALKGARQGSHRDRDEPRVLERAALRLGPAGAWVRSFRRASEDRVPRLVVIPTWQCELRCRYCTIPKQDGRVMSIRTLERTIDLLLSADAPHVDLHFFGGEPFAEWEVLRHAVVWGTARAAEEGRTIRFLFTTNGWALTEEQLSFLMGYDVWFQFSLDGDRETHEESRPARDHGSSYDRSPGGKAGFILASKVEHDVIQVVHPRNAARMAQNFRHILGLGYRRVQLNYALGTWWEPPSIAAWAEGLMEIGREVKARAEVGDPVELVNLEETLLTVRGGLELTIDWDGTVFGSTAFLVLPKKRDKFVLGHLDERRSFDRYVHEAFPMEHLLANWFGEGMAENNHAVGRVLTSFVRWWRVNAPGVGTRPG